ncbi:MAG: TIGR03663 family protein [Anaerolineae bacterium]|nr:TIGR03663 family protein [Anaerolineae bacterium]
MTVREMTTQQTRGYLDTPLADLFRPTWEKAFYALIFVLALVSRFWDLGARAMSHDESLHALYSYYLYSGSGYVHNPMMHGPFLFHANALIYFLFGDNDYTARIVPALFGVAMVMSPLLLRRWLGRLGALIAAALLLISPSILYYSRYIRNDIYITVWTMLLIAALFHFLRSRDPRWFYTGAAVLMLSLATKENAYIFGFIGFIFLFEVLLWERVKPGAQIWLYVGGGALALLLLGGGYLLGRPPAEAAEGAGAISAGLKLFTSVLTVVGGTLPAVLLSASLLRSRHPALSSVEEAVRSLTWRHWLVAGVIIFLIYALLFTTFFTNPLGLGTGVFGSVSYWLAQQEVERGGQPWYYYLLLLPMYEFLPLFFGLVGTLYYLIRGTRPVAPVGELDDATDARGEVAAWAVENARFVAFLILWTLASLFLYSWAGEKMPWLVVHPALPLSVLTAKFLGDVLERVEWREVWRRGGALLLILLPVTLFGLLTLIRLQPFKSMSIFSLQETGNWLLALIITLLMAALTGLVIRRLSGRQSLVVAVVTLLVFLGLFTVRFAWMAAYINYDYATELLVYAHGGADVKPTMDEIAGISARTVGDKMIEVAYDSDVSWPLEWYMREYPNRQFYGETPTRDKVDVPVILAGDKNDAKVQPFLGDRYYRFKRRLVWWPNQEYMGLTWGRISEILTTPDLRQKLWRILYYREYPRTPDDWYHVHNFYLYVRKDVAQQLWDFGTGPMEVIEMPVDPYLEVYNEVAGIATWGVVGVEPGQFNHPRGIATGPYGTLYVVDSDNNRVQVFDDQGALITAWGSRCDLSSGTGCEQPGGPGQFQEPWGIDVDAQGRAYVADTWNHRIQVFDAGGAFLNAWGTFGETTTDPYLFYGPRDVAVDDDLGRVYVTDTGNERVVVFDLDGNHIASWGGEGIGPGSFAEPVGIDVDLDGNVYLVDTWNQRVQVFDSEGTYLREWVVDAWYGESVVNKPFLAVDGQGRVYVTDPEGYRVAVFGPEGEILATFGRYGFDAGAFSLPTGITVDAEGTIYVTDTDGQRVIKFAPLFEE